MENWDEDFSTIKGSFSFNQPQKNLATWKPDIPLADGDMTLRKNQKPSFNEPNEISDDDFAEEFETAVKSRRPQVHYEENLPEAFMSDSSVKSPGRASVSSAASASSAATSWDCDDDFGFDIDDDEFPDNKIDLASRFRARQERSRAEANAEAAQLAANYAKTVTKNRLSERNYGPAMNYPDDDLLDLGLEQLTLRVKNGTVNQNIKLQHPSNNPESPSKLLRGMRSIAQLPQKRSEIPPPPQRLRGAVSMLDFGKMQPNQQPQSRTPLQYGQSTPSHLQNVQRPLTAYREPTRNEQRSNPRKQKSKKPNLIQNPAHTLKRQERNGMVLNPKTGLWEGNDVDASRFDSVDNVKPTLITKQVIENQSIPQAAAPNGMLFDKRTLSWIYANEDEYDDPFAGLDENSPISTPSPSPKLQPSSYFTPLHNHTPSMQSMNNRIPRISHSRSSRKVTNESVASTTSFASSTNFGRQSVARSETSGYEVFEISARMASEWKHADERFMRKFGKWIGSDEEKADALQSDQHFYEMVKNA